MPSTRTTQPCPVGCGRNKNPDYLMCRACWSKVPRDVQAEVYDAVRTFRRMDGSLTLRGLRAVQAVALAAAVGDRHNDLALGCSKVVSVTYGSTGPTAAAKCPTCDWGLGA